MKSDLVHMSKAGKTFFFSSLWLKKETRLDVAKVYNFCRTVDDIADKYSEEEERDKSLIEIFNAIKNKDSRHPVVEKILSLIIKFPEIELSILELVSTCLNDKAGIEFLTKEELIVYAKGVAGTVGLIMYPILGGTDPRGRAHAEALGIAMQCTNIARDVIEDFNEGRIYLPKEWLGDTQYSKILEPDFEGNIVFSIKGVLQLADFFYESGLTGLDYLKPECRRAVEIAALCYSEIGHHIIKDGKLVRQRAVVGLSRKLSLALSVHLFRRASISRTINF